MAEQGLVYNIKADVTDALSKLNQLQKAIGKADKDMERLGEASRDYLNEVSKSLAELKNILSSLNIDKDIKKKLDDAFDDLSQKLTNAKTKATNTNKAIEKFSKETVDGVQRSWRNLQGDLEDVAKNLEKQSKDTSDQIKKDTETTASVLTNSISTISGAIATLGITKLTKDIVEAASKAERALFALNKLYKSNAAEAQATAEALADVYALSEANAARQLADASKILDIYNLSDDILLQMSSNMVALSQDMAAFTGGAVDASRAMSALEAALNADYRGLKKTFGIFVNNDTITALAKRWGLQSDALTDAQKVLLRYEAVMEAATNVTGSFTESQDSLYVTTQELKAAWSDLQVVLGEKFLPIATSLMKTLTTVVSTFDSWTGTVALAGAAILVIVSAANRLLLVLTKLKTVVLALAAHPLVAALTALLALIPVIIASSSDDKFQKAAEATDSLTASVDAYVEAEKKRKEAIDDVNASLLEQEAISNRASAKSSVTTMISLLEEQKKAMQSLADTRSQLEEQRISSFSAAGALIEERYGGDVNAAKGDTWYQENLRIYKDAMTAISALDSEMDKAGADILHSLDTLAASYAKLRKENTDGVFTPLMESIQAVIQPNQLPYFNEKVKEAEKNLDGVGPAAEDASLSIKELAEQLGFVEQDWGKMLEKSTSQLENSREALKKQSDEYRKIRDDALQALDTEYKGYLADIDAQIEKLTERKVTSPNPEAIQEEIDRLEASKEKAKQWYDEEYEYYNNVYLKNIQTAAEKLEDKLAALVYKREQNLKEQETQALTELEAKWKEYAEIFNASIGGGTNISSVGSSRESLDAYIETIKGLPDVNESTISKLITDWETYYKSIGDIEAFYSRQREEKQRALEDELLSAQLSSDRLTLAARQDLEMMQLERKHDAERKELEREYKDSEDYEKMKSTLLATQFRERENMEDAHQKKLKEIERTQNKELVESEKALLYDKEEIYLAERAIIEDELAYELVLAETNGKDKLKIQETYNNKLEKMERDHYNEMAKISRQYTDELVRARAANNASSGGFLANIVALSSAMGDTRRDAATGIRDYIGNVSGINKTKFSDNAFDIMASFNGMMKEGLSEQEMKENFKGMMDTLEYQGEDFEQIWGNIWEKVRATTKSEMASIVDIVNQSLSKMSEILSNIDTLYTMAEQNRMQNLQNMMDDLQNQQDKLEKEAQDSGRKLTKNEQDMLKRRQDLYEEQMERQEALIAEEQKRQFERQKAFTIAETTIEGLQAAVKAYTANISAGPWAAAAAAALSTAFTGAQIALIKAQPVPSYAQGAYELPQDQMAQVHKGEMIVPKPFAEEIRDNGGFGGEITVNVYGAGEDATVESSVDSDGLQKLDVYVTGKVKGMVANGELDTVLQSRYTLNRNGRRG